MVWATLGVGQEVPSHETCKKATPRTTLGQTPRWKAWASQVKSQQVRPRESEEMEREAATQRVQKQAVRGRMDGVQQKNGEQLKHTS
eukprot:852396-Amphidinium_carterae.1